jgi:TM2 domain-containing membrane protein YozV
MKTAVKAALLSGFVFPGVGQIYLKRYLRGLIILIPVLLGLIIIVGIATVDIMESLKQIEAGATDANTMLTLAASHSARNDIVSKAISLFIACCWLFSMIDAYSIGRRKSMLNARDEKEIRTKPDGLTRSGK